MLTAERAFDAARRMFIATGALDMDELARALFVSRATLYRVVGNRDRLLGEVLWSLAEPTMRRALADADGAGAERILDAGERYTTAILGFEPFRRFVRAEPLTAFRVLLTPAGGVIERTVTTWRRVIEDEASAGHLTLPLDVETFSYVLVRTWESMLYSDLLGGLPPDVEKARVVARALFAAAQRP